MDSQLTLVDTSPIPSDECVVFTFDRDDMRNTTLHVRGADLPSYFVDTPNNITTVSTGDFLLATIVRRKFRPDQITFPALRPMNLGSWLKSPILSSCPLEFRVYGRRFEWRENSLGQIVLCESDYPDDTLAWFSKSCRDLRGRPMRAAYLAIKPEIVEMKDMVVLSCVLAEHKLRAGTAAQGKTVLDTMVLSFW